MPLKTKRSSRILFLIFLLGATSIAAAGYLYYQVFAAKYRTEVERQLHVVAELKALDLERWRSVHLSDAEFYFKNAAFSGLVQRAFQPPADKEALQQLRFWLNSAHEQHRLQYDWIALLDADGVDRISIPNQPIPVASILRRQISEAAVSMQVRFVDFYRDENDGRIYLALVIPIPGPAGSARAAGTLLLRIDPEAYLYPQIRRWPTPSSTAETLLVRREGDDALFLSDLRFRPNSALDYRIPLSREDNPAAMAIRGAVGFVEGIDYRGVPVVAELRAIPGSPWFLIARMDIAEVYAPIRERLWAIVLVAGLLLGGWMVSLGFLWRGQVNRYYKVRAESAESLRELNELLDITLKSIGDAVISTDVKGCVVSLNPVASALTGWTQQDAAGRPLPEIFPIINAQTREPVENPVAKVLQTGAIIGLANHTVLIARDGTERQIADSASPIRDASGRTRGVVLIFRDVTEEYHAIEEIKRSRAELKAIYDHAPVMMCVLDGSRNVLYANHAFAEFTGRSEDELKGGRACGVFGCVHASEDSRGCGFGPGCADCPLPRALEDTFQSGNEHHNIEYQTVLSIGGQPREVVLLGATARFQASGQNHVLLCLNDITERKRIQEKLRASEELHRKLIEASPDVVAVADLQGRLTYCSSRALDMFGVDRVEDLLASDAVQWLAPEDRERARKEIADRLRGKETRQNRYTAQRKDGSRFTVEINSAPIAGTGGKPAGIVSILRDVTWQAQAQQALRESEERFRSLFENMAEGVALHELVYDGSGRAVDYRILDYNPAYERHTGLSPRKGSRASEAYGSVEPPYLEEYARAAGGGEPLHFETFYPPLGRHFSISAVSNGPGRFSTVFEDITERKQSERRLRASEAFSSGVLNSLTAHIAVLNEAGVVTAVNEAWRRFARENGGDAENGYVGVNYLSACENSVRATGDEEAAAALKKVQDLAEGKQARISFEYSCSSPDEERWFSLNATRFESDGRFYTVVANENITRLKKAQEYLRLQEEFSRALLENVGDGVIACDGDMNLVLCNRTAREWHGEDSANVSSEQRIAYFNLYDADGIRLLGLDEIPLVRAFRGERVSRVSVTIKAPGRPPRHVMANGTAFYDEDGSKLGAVVILRDITPLRKHMEELQNSVREKEALLREVHHRVKNNLQVISSLLSLESSRMDNPSTKSTLQDLRSRIRSMALLHETIYSSDSLAQVELQAYLNRLCRNLFYSLLPHPELVNLELNIDPISLDVSQALPCGLAVNELLSNSLKHAFPGGRKGIVRVEATRADEDGLVRLRVSDDGVGLPQDFDLKRLHSLGLQLVSDLAGQLGGRFEIGPGPGAVFTIMFAPKNALFPGAAL